MSGLCYSLIDLDKGEENHVRGPEATGCRIQDIDLSSSARPVAAHPAP